MNDREQRTIPNPTILDKKRKPPEPKDEVVRDRARQHEDTEGPAHDRGEEEDPRGPRKPPEPFSGAEH
jgi:hypothetical protein